MSILKMQGIKQLIVVAVFLKTATVYAAAQAIGSVSQEKYSALHAEDEYMFGGQYISSSANSFERALDQRTRQVYSIPDYCDSNITFSPSGELMAASCKGRLHVWREASCEPVVTIEKALDYVFFVSFVNEREVVISGSGTTRVWDIESGELKKEIEIHSKAFNSATNRLFGMVVGEGAGIWNLTSGIWEKKISGAYLIAAFNGEGNKIAFRSYENSVGVIDIDKQLVEYWLYEKDPNSLAFSPEGKNLAMAMDDKIQVYDVQTKSLCKEISVPADLLRSFFSIAYSGDMFVARLGSGGIGIFDAQTGRLERFWQEGKSVRPIAVSPDGSKIASVFYEPKTRTNPDKCDVRTYDQLYKRRDILRVLNIEELHLIVSAALCWKDGKAFPVDLSNPVFQSLIARFPEFRNERYFTESLSSASI